MVELLSREDRQFDVNGFRTKKDYHWNRIKSVTSERARIEAAKRREAVAKYRMENNDYEGVGRSQSKSDYKKMMKGLHNTRVNTSNEELEKVFKRRTGEHLDKYATVHRGVDKFHKYVVVPTSALGGALGGAAFGGMALGTPGAIGGAIAGAATPLAGYMMKRSAASFGANAIDRHRKSKASNKYEDVRLANHAHLKAREDANALYDEMLARKASHRKK